MTFLKLAIQYFSNKLGLLKCPKVATGLLKREKHKNSRIKITFKSFMCDCLFASAQELFTLFINLQTTAKRPKLTIAKKESVQTRVQVKKLFTRLVRFSEYTNNLAHKIPDYDDKFTLDGS